MSGGGTQLWCYAEIAALQLHSVLLQRGGFILHWSDDHPTQCLTLVTRIMQVREEAVHVGGIWLEVLRFPGVVAPATGQLRLTDTEWQLLVVVKM
jgi:hypothetical protein